MSAVWSIEQVSARQGGRTVLESGTLEAAAGEIVGVVGPNGAGKTTLLRVGLGLAPFYGGVGVWLGGKPIGSLSAVDRSRLAGYLPQERRVGWNLPALQIVALGAPHLAPALAEARALAALDRVGLAALAERGVLDMSGGERARVLLARLLVTEAPLLVADEPVAGLDPDAQLLTLDLLRAEAARGAAVVVTLHDLTLAARACDRLVVLNEGRVVAWDTPRESLSPKVLSEVFGLDGELVETPAGLVLAARRAARRG